MARKRYSDEDALKLLREIDVYLHDGLDVVSAWWRLIFYFRWLRDGVCKVCSCCDRVILNRFVRV